MKIHNMDVVNDPLTNMCAFFEVQCSQDYIQSLSIKFLKLSRKSES
jgi:hypothetical protein